MAVEPPPGQAHRWRLVLIWFWLAVAAVNLLVGVFVAGIPLLTEILVLLVVFGVPAAAGWYLSRRLTKQPAAPT